MGVEAGPLRGICPPWPGHGVFGPWLAGLAGGHLCTCGNERAVDRSLQVLWAGRVPRQESLGNAAWCGSRMWVH